jgi:hypothetical protein
MLISADKERVVKYTENDNDSKALAVRILSLKIDSAKGWPVARRPLT